MSYIKDLLSNIIGAYTPVTYQQTIESELVDVIPSGLSGVDWGFVMSALFLVVCFYSCMRLLGVILTWAIQKGGRL